MPNNQPEHKTEALVNMADVIIIGAAELKREDITLPNTLFCCYECLPEVVGSVPMTIVEYPPDGMQPDCHICRGKLHGWYGWHTVG